MASGKKHAAANKLTLVAVSAAALFYLPTIGEQEAIALIAGAAIGYLITPDIDHHVRTHEEWRIIQISKLIGKLWVAYWSPYAALMPHRYWLGHMPGIGTALRALYLLIPAIYYYGGIDFLLAYPRISLSVFIGWTIQDVAHAILDGWKFAY